MKTETRRFISKADVELLVTTLELTRRRLSNNIGESAAKFFLVNLLAQGHVMVSDNGGDDLPNACKLLANCIEGAIFREVANLAGSSNAEVANSILGTEMEGSSEEFLLPTILLIRNFDSATPKQRRYIYKIINEDTFEISRGQNVVGRRPYLIVAGTSEPWSDSIKKLETIHTFLSHYLDYISYTEVSNLRLNESCVTVTQLIDCQNIVTWAPIAISRYRWTEFGKFPHFGKGILSMLKAYAIMEGRYHPTHQDFEDSAKLVEARMVGPYKPYNARSITELQIQIAATIASVDLAKIDANPDLEPDLTS